MLSHFKEILSEKVESRTAVGAFNTFNLEITQAIIRGAVKAGRPAVVQTTENAVKYAGLKALYHLIKFTIEAESGQVPIAMHLDHGKNLETVKACVDLGYSSVHMDASDYAFNDNIKLTKEAVEYGHNQGVLVQGELGNIYGKEGLIKMQQGEDLKKLMTNPDQIEEFISRTGVDTVAVSLGNLHGSFIGQENLDMPRLQEISKKIKTPIVLHGGSGIPENQIKEAIKLGVRIINVDTDLRIAFKEALQAELKLETDQVDPRKILKPSVARMSEVVVQKIKIFDLN